MQLDRKTDSGIHDLLYAREFTHRAANMLQIALAALHHGRRSGERAIDLAIARLEAAADLHRMLTMPGTQLVDLKDALDDVCRAVRRSEIKEHLVHVSVRAPRSLVLPNDARRLTMMVAELVANSMRHAFPGGTGSIAITCTDDGLRTDILIEDDGACDSWKRSGGQGCGIVDAIAEDMGGSVSRLKTFRGSLRVHIALPSVLAAIQPYLGSA